MLKVVKRLKERFSGKKGIAQGSPMGPDLFKNDIHAK
jgi:hypothetical protein